jgi:hypothetical protein
MCHEAILCLQYGHFRSPIIMHVLVLTWCCVASSEEEDTWRSRPSWVQSSVTTALPPPTASCDTHKIIDKTNQPSSDHKAALEPLYPYELFGACTLPCGDGDGDGYDSPASGRWNRDDR